MSRRVVSRLAVWLKIESCLIVKGWQLAFQRIDWLDLCMLYSLCANALPLSTSHVRPFWRSQPINVISCGGRETEAVEESLCATSTEMGDFDTVAADATHVNLLYNRSKEIRYVSQLPYKYDRRVLSIKSHTPSAMAKH